MDYVNDAAPPHEVYVGRVQGSSVGVGSAGLACTVGTAVLQWVAELFPAVRLEPRIRSNRRLVKVRAIGVRPVVMVKIHQRLVPRAEVGVGRRRPWDYGSL